jgi:hypothetical protein
MSYELQLPFAVNDAHFTSLRVTGKGAFVLLTRLRQAQADIHYID